MIRFHSLLQHHAGDIPSSLGQLKSLQHLYLGQNQLIGEPMERVNVCGSRNGVRTTEDAADLSSVGLVMNCLPSIRGRDTIAETVGEMT